MMEQFMKEMTDLGFDVKLFDTWIQWGRGQKNKVNLKLGGHRLNGISFFFFCRLF